MPPHTKRQALIDAIRADIRAGRYAAGEQLPSGRELATDHKCSMMTVRVAIDELRLTGWVITVPGKGVFVAEHPPT